MAFATTDPRCNVVRMLNTCADPLITAFFAPANIANVQTRLQQAVFQEIGVRIGQQPQEGVILAMVQAYQLYGAYDPKTLAADVASLSDQAVQGVLPGVLSNIQQLGEYLKQASNGPQLLSRPVNTSSTGTSVLDLRYQLR